MPKPITAFELVEADAPKAAIKSRLTNEMELTKEAIGAVTMQACVCQRQFPYSGVGKVMCRRCRVLVLWETLNDGKSVTQTQFDVKMP